MQVFLILAMPLSHARCADKCQPSSAERQEIEGERELDLRAFELLMPHLLEPSRPFIVVKSKVENVLLLASTLRDEDVSVRLHAASVLGEFGPQASSAVPSLSRALKDEEAIVRWAAVKAIGRIGRSAGPAIPGLLETLSDPNAVIAAAALRTLEEIGPDAIAPLQIVLDDLEPSVAERAANVLQRLSDEAKGGRKPRRGGVNEAGIDEEIKGTRSHYPRCSN
jgi:HEAT repeat protein